MILLAYQGYCEEREETERMMYGAQGIRLPERISKPRSAQNHADEWRIFTVGHNARMRHHQRRKPNPNG